MIAEKQQVNRAWAERVVASARRHGVSAAPERLRLRAYLLECMIDDALREIFVIGNPDIVAQAADLDRLADEITRIWFMMLHAPDPPEP